jgi:hypothetical protein
VNLADWREACHWISENAPPDAVFLTPRLDHTFRWYAQRAEVASRKDIPQDAPGIVEWWRRNCELYRSSAGPGPPAWQSSQAELGAARLTELGRKYGADYVITTPFPAVALERVGPRHLSYAIYRLPAEAPRRPSQQP